MSQQTDMLMPSISQGTRGRKIVVDGVGSYFTMGYFDYLADFDPGSGSLNVTPFGGTGIFCVNLDASGNLIYSNHYGGTLLLRCLRMMPSTRNITTC